MKRFTLLTLMMLVTIGLLQAQIISQYIETDSGTSPKGIEIWNNTGATLDFAANNLVIEKGVNGGTPSEDYTLDSGTLASGAVIVIGTSDLETTTINNGAAFYEKGFTFNGNDALVVKYGTTTIDVFGMPGEDPGSEWTGNGVSTKNQNIALLDDIDFGDPDGWTDPSERFETISTTPSSPGGDEGFGLAPGASGPPSITNIIISPEEPNQTQSVAVSADVTDDGSITTVELNWGTTSGSYPNTINMSNTGGMTYLTDSDIPAQPLGTTVYFEIFAEDNDGSTSTSPEQSYTVVEQVSYILQETFDSDLGSFNGHSVTGDQVWEWTNYGNPPGSAKMTGYDSGQFPNEDWLISPVMDFSGYSNITLNFDEAINYEGGDINENEEILISTDYTGSGDPNTNGTWTELTVTGRSSGSSWDFVSVDEVDLSTLAGETTVYLAFKYTSTDENAGTWEVDNVIIEEPTLNPSITVTSPNGGEIWEQGSEQQITWETDDFFGDVKIELTGSNPSVIVAAVANSGAYTWNIPADQPLADDYKVMISDAVDGFPADESDDTFSIIEAVNYIHLETFDTDLGTWSEFSVVGDEQIWEWAEYGNPPGSAKMSGYDSGQFPNEDWLISPVLDFSGYSNITLNFDEAINYEDGDINENEEILISTDYTGSGDPNTNGTWTELSVTGRASGSSWDFVSVDPVDLSAYIGEQGVYLAYKYNSSDTNAATWEVDNIAITSEEGTTASITKAYAVSNDDVDVWYDSPMTSVNAGDYELTGSETITFGNAVIDGDNPQLVHLTNASTDMSSDAILDMLSDVANSASFDFYAGISSIDLTNENNPGGTLDTEHIATFYALVSADDGYNNVWVHDQGGAYHGVLIFDYDFPDEVALGDEIMFTAVRDVYNNLSELKDPVLLETVASGLTPYETYIAGSDINEDIPADTDPAEKYEGQLVSISDVTIESYDESNYDYLCSWSDGTTTYYFHLGDNVDYHFNNIILEVGSTYAEIWGVIDWDYDQEYYRINPRYQSDIVEGVSAQTIMLEEGYQFVSTAVIPDDPNLTTLLSPIMDVSLEFVRASDGDMLHKIGPNWVNNIGDWATPEGYLFKMSAADEFSAEGDVIDPQTPIALVSGYQFVSYLHTEPMNAMDAFGGILSDNLDFVRNSAGSQIRKIGPNWVNNIGDAMPTEGYLIKMYNADELIYPEMTKAATGKGQATAQHFTFEGGNAADKVFILYLDGDLNIGDEVAAFAGDKLIGSTVITSDEALNNELAAFETLNSGEGFEAGQAITLKVWDAQTGEVYATDVQFTNPYGDAHIANTYPANDGEYSIAKVTKSSAITAESDIRANVYPNPASDMLTIETLKGVKTISVYNYTGSLVYEKIASDSQLDINVSGFEAGVYVVRITMNDTTISKQIVVK